MIPEPFIARLKERLDLVDVAERCGVSFQTRGGTPKARCPFHDEKTPSFVAHPERFHCYGACGKSWDAIEFVMDRKGLDFRAAVEELASFAGLKVPAENETPAGREARAEEKERRGRMLAVMQAAQDFFRRSLDEYPKAWEYLVHRGLDEVAEDWGIGYAPKGERLFAVLREQGYSDAEMMDAHLARQSETNGEPYPFLRDRITFPVRDLQGRVLAHIGRDIGGEARAKYLGPGDVPGVYTKGETLFGIYEARDAIRKTGEAVVVEGQIDCVTMHRFGFDNTIAVGGTAFTEAQARLLKRAGAERVIWLMDGDAAGHKAMDRAVMTCADVGLGAFEWRLMAGMDPDGWLVG